MGYLSGLEAPKGYVEVLYDDVDQGYMADYHFGDTVADAMTPDERTLLGAITRPGNSYIIQIEESDMSGRPHLAVYEPIKVTNKTGV